MTGFVSEKCGDWFVGIIKEKTEPKRIQLDWTNRMTRCLQPPLLCNLLSFAFRNYSSSVSFPVAVEDRCLPLCLGPTWPLAMCTLNCFDDRWHNNNRKLNALHQRKAQNSHNTNTGDTYLYCWYRPRLRSSRKINNNNKTQHQPSNKQIGRGLDAFR